MKFPSIRIEGAILSPDILDRIEDAPGQKPADFGLDPSAKVKDEIARAWADAQDYWRIFQRKLESQKLQSIATTETRQQWIVPLLGLLGYQLEYQPKGAELNGKTYAISHRAVNRARTPVHIVGYRDPAGLDRKPEVRATGGSPSLRMSPHAMVQEYINLHDQLYGIVTNGRLLRLLRDSSRLVKLSYLEFDLDRIFTDGLFADFALLYRLLHATRLPVTSDTAAESLIERYHQDSIEQGTRIRDGLRAAVTQALEIFGTGFIATPENRDLREQIDSGALDHTVFFSHLMRLIYRLLFLNVVEERGLIFPKGTPAKTLGTYYDYYSVQRLRRLARTRGLRSERHCDAWASLLSTFQIFERPDLAAKLGTTAFGGTIFNAQSLGPLVSCRLSNAAFFNALDRLCSFDDPKTNQRLPVNFGALATEEFGSVYESLLELHPVVETAPSPGFSFKQTAGNDRKTSGSYYTPSCLVDCLLDSALDPVLETRIRDHKTLGFPNAEAAILALKICDPACGSGHFLIAAAQRVARRLALIRAGDEEPAPDQMRRALREVISHCIYAVDINPMAVELCRVALWLEAVEPGKPLSFLNNHIQCGNSLLGTTPALLKRGIPDAAYEPIEGDDKKFAAAWKKRNREAKLGQHDLFADTDATWHYQNALLAATKDIEAISDESFTDVERKEAAYADYLISSSYRFGKRLHDAWCAAFVWQKKDDPGLPEPITQQVIDQMKRDPNLCPERVAEEIDRLAAQYNFFHWHLAFPDVFQPLPDEAIKKTEITGWSGGFNCILGNPPWERTALEELEFFARSSREVMLAPTTALRKKVIQNLRNSDPKLFDEFSMEKRKSEGEGLFYNESSLYPLGAQGRLNTYALFANLGIHLLIEIGRLGMVLQSGLACDAPMEDFWRFLVENQRLVSFLDFENRRRIFREVHAEQKFALVTFTGSQNNIGSPIAIGFWLQDVDELKDPSKFYELDVSDLLRFSPNTGQPLLTRSRSDVDVLRRVYQVSDVCWHAGVRQGRAKAWVAMTSVAFSQFCRTEMDLLGSQRKDNWELMLDGTQYSPLMEAKQIEQYDFSFATYEGVSQKALAGGYPLETKHEDGFLVNLPKPRYWCNAAKVEAFFNSKNETRTWRLVYRDVTNVNNERTAIATVLPAVGFLQPLNGITCSDAKTAAIVLAAINSIVCDFVARMRFSGRHLNVTTFSQLPIPKQIDYSFVLPRVVELIVTSTSLKQFSIDCGLNGDSHLWNSDRRFHLRCELDAAYSHFYGLTVADLSYIFASFNVLRIREEKEYGNYRTRDTVLELYEHLKGKLTNV